MTLSTVAFFLLLFFSPLGGLLVSLSIITVYVRLLRGSHCEWGIHRWHTEFCSQKEMSKCATQRSKNEASVLANVDLLFVSTVLKRPQIDFAGQLSRLLYRR